MELQHIVGTLAGKVKRMAVEDHSGVHKYGLVIAELKHWHERRGTSADEPRAAIAEGAFRGSAVYSSRGLKYQQRPSMSFLAENNEIRVTGINIQTST